MQSAADRASHPMQPGAADPHAHATWSHPGEPVRDDSAPVALHGQSAVLAARPDGTSQLFGV